MREIVLDTETTGLSHKDGHRIIEIGCIELYNLIPTGRHFQTYINPQRDVPPEASAISGIKTEFLQDKPLFENIIDAFLAFIEDSPFVIHNADFDIGFLNMEFQRLDKPLFPSSRAVDTVRLARAKFPGAPASLDALCRRFGIDLSSRTQHGALIDSQLLAQVYLELKGGRQSSLAFLAQEKNQKDHTFRAKTYRVPRPHQPTEEELHQHSMLLEKIKNPIWSL